MIPTKNKPTHASIALFLIFLCFNCSKSSVQSEAEKIKAILTSSPWKVESVEVDGTDQTVVYQNFTLVFVGSSYTTTNGRATWPANGTWSFTDSSGKAIMRDDGLQIDVQEASNSQLILAFNWSSTTYGGGRVKSLGGKNIFTLIH